MGTVPYVARVTPEGGVEAVEILAAPLPGLGFEDAVRTCISEWRFEVATDAAGPGIYEGRVRFRIMREEEAAIEAMLQSLATNWNTGKPSGLDDLEAGPLDVPGFSVTHFLAKQIQGVEGSDKCRMELDPQSGYVRFRSRDTAEVGQGFRCLPSPEGLSPLPKPFSLDLVAAKGKRGWRFVYLSDREKRWLGAVQVGDKIPPPKQTKTVEPVYNPIAMQARVQGLVILSCLVSAEGKVIDTKILRGIPLLDEAAAKAVQQWEYEPTMVDGRAVPVTFPVQVNFRLN